MAKKPHTSSLQGLDADDQRERLAGLKVLVADRDKRTASLVQRVLFSFGFRNIDTTTDGERVIDFLRDKPYDFLIIEWNMQPVDGLTVVKAIRNAQRDERIRRDVPIIMLTARSDVDSVLVARDAGITEFVAKPFSAKTLSVRIIQIIDKPRAFVEAAKFVGPDRRRRRDESEAGAERRGQGKATILPPNNQLRKQLGLITAADILNEKVVSEAQTDLLKAEDDFIAWSRDDIARLRRAFEQASTTKGSALARTELLDAAYAIQSQAAMFGYSAGGEVAKMLTDYTFERPHLNADNLLVIGKHIDVIAIIFKDNIRESGQAVAMDMIHSLKKLIQKKQ